ncbi:MAG TPA: ABC transporter substrate-binding protein [Stellaceae bacterium]|nr:ABC transporter substrate-binding protein [Stellaceae bacterium]
MSNHFGQALSERMPTPADPRPSRGKVHESVGRALWVRRSLRLMILIVGLGLGSSGVAAAAPEAPAASPSGFISGLVNAAFAKIADKQLSASERAKGLRQILDQDFDMPLISRFVLGRYWKEASEADRQRFIGLFEDYVVRSYAQPFSQYYSGETVKVTGARPEGETTTLVQSEVMDGDGGTGAKLDWRVRKDEGGFKIVDVAFEGVSLLITQREQFSAVIERVGGLARLNQELAQKFASSDAAPGQL